MLSCTAFKWQWAAYKKSLTNLKMSSVLPPLFLVWTMLHFGDSMSGGSETTNYDVWSLTQSVSQSERSESLNHQSRELLASEYCSNTFRSIYAGFGSFMLHSEAQITSTTNKHRLLFDRRFAIIAPLLTITDEAQIMLRIDQNRSFEVIKSK